MVKPEFLGLPPEPKGSRSHVLDVNIAFRMHFAEELTERGEDFLDVSGLLGLRVGLIDHLDIEVEAALALGGQRLPPNDPVIRMNVLNRDGGEVASLVQDTSRVFQKHFGDRRSESGRANGTNFD